MSNEVYTVSVANTTTSTNFKPNANRKPQDGDITNVSCYNQLEIDKRHVSLFNELKALDGNADTLSWTDALQAKSNLNGTHDIQKIAIDPEAKVLSFTFNDGTYLRLDMQNDAVKNIQNDIATGDAKYEKWYNIDNLLSSLFSKNGFQDEIIIKVPEGTTIKAIKEKYNLPDGALKSCVTFLQHRTGNADNYTVGSDCKVWFSAKAFAENNGLTIEQVKAMFDYFTPSK